jgi:hypothetical protein
MPVAFEGSSKAIAKECLDRRRVVTNGGLNRLRLKLRIRVFEEQA